MHKNKDMNEKLNKIVTIRSHFQNKSCPKVLLT